jgi:2-haloacid dehalogenase
VLIAAHAWDVDGAKRAGLKAGWLNRKPGDYPDFFERPDVSGDTLGGLVDALLAG